MGSFSIYIQLGFEHIADLAGVDHMLFIMTLCALYKWEEWKKIIILVTAFTVGHSVTLALSALNVVQVNAALIEFLIPCTIIVTGVSNIVLTASSTERGVLYNYMYALFFGLIHGLGFSNFFRELMGPGAAIVKPLLGFNLGLEIGQLMIVGLFFAVYYLLQRIRTFSHKSWTQVISGIGIGAAGLLIIEQLSN